MGHLGNMDAKKNHFLRVREVPMRQRNDPKATNTCNIIVYSSTLIQLLIVVIVGTRISTWF